MGTGDEISTTDDTLKETDLVSEDCVQDKETINEEIEESIVEDVSDKKSSNASEEVIVPNESTTNIATMENVESVENTISEQDQQINMKEVQEVENSTKTSLNKVDQEGQVIEPSHVEPLGTDTCDETMRLDGVDNNAEENADIAENIEEAYSNVLVNDTDETKAVVVDYKDSGACSLQQQLLSHLPC